jgi:hypothetical protein
MQQRLSAAYLPVLLTFALALGGCGSGSSAHPAQSGNGGAAASLQFIAQADAACKHVFTQIEQQKLGSEARKAIRQHKLTSATLGEIARLSAYRVAIENQGLRDLSRLQPPTELAVTWRQMLGYRQALARELDRFRSAAQAGDSKTLNALTPAKVRMHAQLRLVAKRAGFTDCQEV